MPRCKLEAHIAQHFRPIAIAQAHGIQLQQKVNSLIRSGSLFNAVLTIAADSFETMIVCCPNCSTRYNLPAHAAGTMMLTCRSCGERWREAETIEAIEAIEISEAPRPRLLASSVVEHEEAPELEASRLSALAREVQEEHKIRQFKRKRPFAAMGGVWLNRAGALCRRSGPA